jgi:heme A synthase
LLVRSTLTPHPHFICPISLNAKISLEEFKFIFYMEWAHRNLGRLIGVTFVLPAIYFASRGRLSKRDQWKCLALAGGIGFQVRLSLFPLTFPPLAFRCIYRR